MLQNLLDSANLSGYNKQVAFSKLVLKCEGEKRMEHLNVAIADDNQKILDVLENIISMDKELNLVGKAKNGEEIGRAHV